MFDLKSPWPVHGRRAAVLLIAAVVVLEALLLFVDAPVARLAAGLPDWVRGSFAAITDFGRSGWVTQPALVLFVVCAVFARFHPKWTARLALLQTAGLMGFVFLAVSVPGVVTDTLKQLVGRARPELIGELGTLHFAPFSYAFAFESFPSGHTTSAFAIAWTFSFLAPRSAPAMAAFAVVIGLSRIAVGAHYPTDVVAGAVIGTLGAYVVRYLFAGRRWVFERRPDGAIAMRKPAAITRLVRLRR